MCNLQRLMQTDTDEILMHGYGNIPQSSPEIHIFYFLRESSETSKYHLGLNIVYISDRMSNMSESSFFRKFKTNSFYTESHEIMNNSKVRLVKHGH